MKVWIVALSLLLLAFAAPAQNKKPTPGIVPHHIKLQYAGSIGFISAGFGYKSKNEKIHGDFFYGYVPAKAGGIDIHSITAKFTWLPVSKIIKDDVKLDLLTAGILVNYAFGKRYHLFSRTRYTFVYYGFPTAAHLAAFIGGSVSRKKFGLYYEIGTTDRDLMSYITNTRAIGFFEIINIGIGASYKLR